MSLVQKFGLDERRVLCAPCNPEGDRRSKIVHDELVDASA